MCLNDTPVSCILISLNSKLTEILKNGSTLSNTLLIIIGNCVQCSRNRTLEVCEDGIDVGGTKQAFPLLAVIFCTKILTSSENYNRKNIQDMGNSQYEVSHQNKILSELQTLACTVNTVKWVIFERQCLKPMNKKFYLRMLEL